MGSGDAFGSGGRFQTCIAIAADEADLPRVLVDCGATSLIPMRQQQLDPNEIDTVLVSHLHGDHFGGVPFLVLDGQFRRRTWDLTVVGPPGIGTRLQQAMETLFPGSSSAGRRFTVHVVEHADRRTMQLGPLSVSPAPSHSTRVWGGRRRLPVVTDMVSRTRPRRPVPAQ